MTLKALKENIRDLPKLPGVYLMKNAQGEVLYVGKASNLRSRVQSYFSKETGARFQVRFLMPKVASVETMVTDNSKEALLLENTLIKKFRPRYNVQLKDDKSYVSLRLSIKDEAPRLYVTRRIKKDKNLYFGPYTSAGSCREVVEFIQSHFRLRTCSDQDYRNRVRPCLQYQIKRCDAPCVGLISLEEYGGIVKQVRLFLEGRNEDLKKTVFQKMQSAAKDERYEEAAGYRDLLCDIESTMERQKVVSHEPISRDVIGYFREGSACMICIMMIREGNLQESCPILVKSFAEEDEILSSFLSQYYEEGRVTPGELLLPIALADSRDLEAVLRERSGHRVRLIRPRRGEKASLIELARQNARQAYLRQSQRDKDQRDVLVEAKKALHLRKVPTRLECYDISHFQGRDSMGSMVTFIGGRPANHLYRHFKIKSVEGSDDFASLYEVISRRIRRARSSSGTSPEDPWTLPDLVVIDGGKGQLNAAAQAFKDMGVGGVDLISLAKSRLKPASRPEETVDERERSEERIFLLGRKDPIRLPKRSSVLFLLMKARDEAHRFGIESHRKALKRRTLYSGLDNIEGVGKVRRQKLLRTFGSLKKIKVADVAEIARRIGCPLELAQKIKESL